MEIIELQEKIIELVKMIDDDVLILKVIYQFIPKKYKQDVEYLNDHVSESDTKQ